MQRATLLTITAYTSVLRLIGQIVAFVSGVTISASFGATSATDNYYAALILPAALANLIINILTNRFAPIYLEQVHQDPTQRRAILSSLSFVVSVALAGGVIVSFIAVPVSMTLRTLQTPEMITQASIFGIAFVALTPLVGFTRLLSIVCETHKHYLLPTVAALLNPIIFILVLLFTVHIVGIYSLLCANLAGQIAELLILTAYSHHKLKISFCPSLRLHPAVHEMLLQSIGPAITYIALFFIPTFDRSAAAVLNAGSLTAFHFGERLVTVLDLIIMSSVVTVVSNHWAQRAAECGINESTLTFNLVISSLLFVLIPLSFGGFALSRPIISVLFQHRNFTANEASAQVFGLLLLSAPLNYLIVLIVRLLLIAKDLRAQMILALSISVLNTILNIGLAPLLGLAGIALSTLLSRTLSLALSYILLQHRLPEIDIRPILPNLARTFLSTLSMLITLLFLQSVLSPALSRTYGLLPQILALSTMISIGVSIYLCAAWLTHHPEFISLRQILIEQISMRLSASKV